MKNMRVQGLTMILEGTKEPPGSTTSFHVFYEMHAAARCMCAAWNKVQCCRPTGLASSTATTPATPLENQGAAGFCCVYAVQ
jgi:hypothetical protein